MEPCIGCGLVAARHPFVAVVRDQETGGFEAFPVCEPCWREPGHRASPIKAHFFRAEDAAVAVQAAGRGDIG